MPKASTGVAQTNVTPTVHRKLLRKWLSGRRLAHGRCERGGGDAVDEVASLGYAPRFAGRVGTTPAVQPYRL